MKCLYFLQVICLGLFSFFTNNSEAQTPADPSSIIGKVVCGYQGWFTAEGDGSPINTWSHWSIGTAPKAGVLPNPNPNLDFDVYPDVEYYNSSSLFQTNFANLGDGTPSKLYASIKQDVTDKQFSLMQKNGIEMSTCAKVFPNPFTDKIGISLIAEEDGILNMAIILQTCRKGFIL